MILEHFDTRDHVRFSWLHDVVKTRSLDVCVDFFSQESYAYVPEKIKKTCWS